MRAGSGAGARGRDDGHRGGRLGGGGSVVGGGSVQLALALGAPLGAMAWGGAHAGVLPLRFRVASGVAGVVIYPVFVALVLASAGVALVGDVPRAGQVAMWMLTAFFALGTAANGVSRSAPERIWAPVSLVVALCCAVIALEG